MRGPDNKGPPVEVIKGFLSWERRTLEREFFVLVDPVSGNGDRHDVAIVGSRADLADYQVLWNGWDPNSTWALCGGVIRGLRARRCQPANKVKLSPLR